MKWIVRGVEGEHRIELSGEGADLKAKVDGVEQPLDVLEVDQGGLSLLLGGRSYAVDFERKREQLGVWVSGQFFPLTVIDERRARLQGAAADLQGPQTLVSPMPGKVVRLLVKVGDAVEAGQGLVVIEAMKMENELRAGRAGKVKEIAVVEGAAVEGGAKLCVVE